MASLYTGSPGINGSGKGEKMLYQIFTQILGRSITASVVIVAVLLIRGLMHRMPKKYLYLLWGIVAVRLLCPAAVSSPVSLFNVIGQNMEADLVSMAEVEQKKADAGQLSSGGISGGAMKQHTASVPSPLKENNGSMEMPKEGFVTGNTRMKQVSSLIQYGTVIWFAGMLVLFLWNALVTFQMKKRLEKSVRYQGNIYECDNIPSPFVMGMVHPRIYIPFRLGEEERVYILKHEQYHMKRRDYIVKFGAFLLTCVYWFHPLVWLSYFLMVRDMEMSCDEYVLQNVSADIRTIYSKSLLGFAANRRGMAAGWLAFGETDTRKRVNNVLNFKKHGKWMGVFAVFLLIFAGSVCLTNAKESKKLSVERKQSTSQKEKNGAEMQKVTEEGEETPEVYQAILAGSQAHGYQVEIVHKSKNKLPKKVDLDFGMYEGKFVIQTYKDNAICAEYTLQLADIMYFPADGFDLVIRDYDGDGAADDFALGQGQTPDPMLGNFMNYFFFAVNEDGSITQHTLSTRNGKSLFTIPDAFSKDFECRDGRIVYQALGEDGTEEQMARIVQ